MCPSTPRAPRPRRRRGRTTPGGGCRGSVVGRGEGCGWRTAGSASRAGEQGVRSVCFRHAARAQLLFLAGALGRAQEIQRACAWQALAAQGRAGRPHGWRGARRTRARGTADTFLPGAHAPQGRRALCSPRLPACRPARTHAPCHRQCRAPLVPTPPSGGRSAAPRRQPSRQRHSRAVWLQDWPSFQQGKKHRKRKEKKRKKRWTHPSSLRSAQSYETYAQNTTVGAPPTVTGKAPPRQQVLYKE